MIIYCDRGNEGPLEDSIWKMAILSQDKKKIMRCKWAFTVKHKSRTIKRYNAKLVVKGYTQTYEIYYKETFAPTANMSTAKVILSFAPNLHKPLQHN